MDTGVEVWIRQEGKDVEKPEELWIHGNITKKVPEGDKIKIFVQDAHGKEHSFLAIKDGEETNELKFRNTQYENFQHVHNLIDLPHLNEPEILHGLQSRFIQYRYIYTYTGPVLIALNPSMSNITPDPSCEELFLKFITKIKQQATIGASPATAGDLLNDATNGATGSGTGLPTEDSEDFEENAISMTNLEIELQLLIQQLAGNSIAGSSRPMSNANGGGMVIGGSASSAAGETEDLSNNNSKYVRHSILISGESGSGKTEVAKMLVKFMTTQANNAKKTTSSTVDTAALEDIVAKVTQATSILEAFGNANTIHSSNSSRFGQFLNLEFNYKGDVIDGSIKTYLLENVRVINQQYGERNFHIFYQLLSGSSDEILSNWCLTNGIQQLNQYNYLSKGHVTMNTETINKDKRLFQQLLTNMELLGFSKEDIELVLQIIAGIIQLGNMKFTTKYTDGGVEGSDVVNDFKYPNGESQLELVARLLGVEPSLLASTLTIKTMTSRGETFKMQVNPQAATNARDAIAKVIYRICFDFLTKEINKKLKECRYQYLNQQVNTLLSSSNSSSSSSVASPAKSLRQSKEQLTALGRTMTAIGILDIYGFDSFDVNTFEQLCINYANEALQQEFNHTMFKLELQEYDQEAIKLYDTISFADNTKIMDLLTQGIFRVLDDQCRLPNATDTRLAGQLYRDFDSHSHFKATSTQKVKGLFSIVHFAGTVVYTTEGFIEKNMDELPSEGMMLLTSSINHILSHGSTLMTAAVAASSAANTNATGGGGAMGKGMGGGAGGGRKSTPSAVTQYKQELGTLIKHVSTTTPHYIRCINPIHREHTASTPPVANAITDRRASIGGKSKVVLPASSSSTHVSPPGCKFDQREVAEQLRYGGIFEALRVSRLGYPIRYQHVIFLQRYRSIVLLGNAEMKRRNKPLMTASLSTLGGGGTGGAENNQERLKNLCRVFIECVLEMHASNHQIHEQRYGSSSSSSSNTNQKTSLASIVSSFPSNGLTSLYGKNMIENNIQIGLTKIFMKSVEHDILEHYRSRVIKLAVNVLERCFRHFLQGTTRRLDQLNKLQEMKLKIETEHALKLQAFYRGYLIRKRFGKAARLALKRKSSMNEARAKAQALQLQQEISRESTRVTGVNIVSFPEELQPIVLAARTARRSRNLSTKVQEYKQRDERLLQEINMLITAKRQSDEICLLRFDISKAKILVNDWSNLFSGVLRDKVSSLARTLAYGYELLNAEKLIPVSTLGKAFGLGRPSSTDARSVRNANKSITTDHKMFKNIYKILEKIKELMEIAHAERLAIDERHKKGHLGAGSNHGGPVGGGGGGAGGVTTAGGGHHHSSLMSDADVAVATSNITKVMDFCRILYQYYSQYITNVVKEYGDHSPYKEKFEDENHYVKSLASLIDEKKPLLSIEKQQVVSPYIRATNRTAAMENLFPTTISVFSLPLLPPPAHVVNSANYNYSRGERSVVFKYIRYAPGVEYAVNCLFTLLQREALMYPIRLIKLVGRSASNYGQVAYYQAAMHFSEETIRTILDPEIDRYFAQHGSFPPSSLDERERGDSGSVYSKGGSMHSGLPSSPSPASSSTPSSPSPPPVPGAGSSSSTPMNLNFNIDSHSYSVAVICNLLTHCIYHGEAENYMIMKNPNNNSSRIVGINNTKLFCDQMFLFNTPAKRIYPTHSASGANGASASSSGAPGSSSSKALKRGNILFALPQVHHTIDSELRNSLINSSCLVEEVMSSWLRELYLQNKRYESLTTSGFTAEDLAALSVPITLPPNAVVTVYKKFREIIRLLASYPNMTHAQLIAKIYPELKLPKSTNLYRHSTSFMLRGGTVKERGGVAGGDGGGVSTPTGGSVNHGAAASSVASGSQSDRMETVSYESSDDETGGNAGEEGGGDRNGGEGPEITVYNTSFYQNDSMLSRFSSSIEEVAVEFLTSIDFSRFFEPPPQVGKTSSSSSAADRESSLITQSFQTCGVVSDNLSFLPSLWIRNVSVEQLTVMFGGLVELAYRFNQDHRDKPNAATYSSKLFTKHIFILDKDDENRERVASSLIVDKIQHLVGIQVTFMAEDIFDQQLQGGHQGGYQGGQGHAEREEESY